MSSKISRKIVKPQSKGMVTIPTEFRQKLSIDENTLLEARLVKNGVLFMKINYLVVGQKPSEMYPKLYSKKEIEKFMKDDRLDVKTVRKLKKFFS